MNGIEKLFLELNDKEAIALAHLVKSLKWSELGACAISDDETYLMKDAIDKIAEGLELRRLRTTLNPTRDHGKSFRLIRQSRGLAFQTGPKLLRVGQNRINC